MSSARRTILNLVFLLMACLPSILIADTLTMKNDTRIFGTIVEETEKYILINIGTMEITVSRDSIVSIERGISIEAIRHDIENALREVNALINKGDIEAATRLLESTQFDLENTLKTMTDEPPALLELKAQIQGIHQKIVPKDPASQKVEELYQQALYQIDHVHYEVAVDILTRAIALKSDAVQVHLKRAEAALQVNKIDIAIQSYEKVLEVQPRIYYASLSTPLHQLLQRRWSELVAQRKNVEALPYLKSLLLIQSRHAETPVRLSDYMKRRDTRSQQKEQEILMELFEYVYGLDMFDFSLFLLSRIEALDAAFKNIAFLKEKTTFLIDYKKSIQAGDLDAAVRLKLEASSRILNADDVQQKIARYEGLQSTEINMKLLHKQCNVAFEKEDYKTASELAKKIILLYPGTEQSIHATQILHETEIEVPVEKSLKEADEFVKKRQYAKAKNILQSILKNKTMEGSKHISAVRELNEKIPMEETADSLWMKASDSLNEDDYALALTCMEELQNHYRETMAGKEAKVWFEQYGERLVRESEKEYQLKEGLFADLALYNFWVEHKRAPSREGLRIQSIPESERPAAMASFQNVVTEDLIPTIDTRSPWLFFGPPLLAGLGILVLIFKRITGLGKGRFIEAEESSEQRDPDGAFINHLASSSGVCRLCGLPMPTTLDVCSHCGISRTLTLEEKHREEDEHRWSDFDPWEYRLRGQKANRFDTYYKNARELEEKGKYDEALTMCRQALKEDLRRKEGFELLARLYEKTNEPLKAASCYKEVLLIDPSDIPSRNKLEVMKEPLSKAPLRTTSINIFLSASFWWLIFWISIGIDPRAWFLRILFAFAGGCLTFLLLERLQKSSKIHIHAKVRETADMHHPLSETSLSWKNQNRQARFIAKKIYEHVGIHVPSLTLWSLLFALILSFLLLVGLCMLAWVNHAPYILLGWPAGVFLFLYFFEVYPRALAAHIILRHGFQETNTPWMDPHRPFIPPSLSGSVKGEFLMDNPDVFPLKWALNPFPYGKTRQGVLNGLQQTMNRNFVCHRFYHNLRIVLDFEIPIPPAVRTIIALLFLSVISTFVGWGLIDAHYKEQKSRFFRAMEHGFAYLLDGDIARAKSNFNEAIRLDDQRISPFLYLAHTNAAAQMNDAAERAFLAAIALPHKLSAVYNDYANFLQRQERFKEAIPLYEKALALAPQNADILHNIGVAYYNLMDYPRAYSYISRSVQMNPQHEYAYTVIGLIHEAQGDIEKARDAFQQAITVAPDMNLTKLARDRLAIDLEYERANPLRLPPPGEIKV